MTVSSIVGSTPRAQNNSEPTISCILFASLAVNTSDMSSLGECSRVPYEGGYIWTGTLLHAEVGVQSVRGL